MSRDIHHYQMLNVLALDGAILLRIRVTFSTSGSSYLDVAHITRESSV